MRSWTRQWGLGGREVSEGLLWLPGWEHLGGLGEGCSPQDGGPGWPGKGSEISSGCAELDVRGPLDDVHAAAAG